MGVGDLVPNHFTRDVGGLCMVVVENITLDISERLSLKHMSYLGGDDELSTSGNPF